MTEEYYQENEITCPYCGNENLDSWEVGTGINEGDLGEQECGSCEKKFTASRNMSITYDSSPTPCLNGEGEHDWKPIIGYPKEFFKDKYRCDTCGKEKKDSSAPKGSGGEK